MNAKKMIELLQQHHPHIGETEAYILINQAKDDFCQDTEMVKGLGSFTTTAGTLLYDRDLSTGGVILKILNVWIGDYQYGGDSASHIKAPRLQGTLNIKDIV
tara:strand:- start:1742 stop:2047 length:306 start_codon:yes stop_codon:yes gene_type:complete